MDTDTRTRVGRRAAKRVVEAVRVTGSGYTPAERWRVRFADGTTAFAKVATTPFTGAALRAEAHVYARLHGPFLPARFGFDDHPERPVLLLEDLSAARWPPPWEDGDPERVVETVRRMAATRPLPDGLQRLADLTGVLRGWDEVARDPGPFLALHVASPPWLERALPALRAAAAAAPVDGDDLLHLDLRSDNVALLPDRVVLVDWSGAARGNGLADLAFFAPSLRLEGGPLPDTLLPDAGPLAAVVAGFFAARAGLEEIPDAPRVRWIQRRQLCIALPWACRVLGLPEPDGQAHRTAQARIDADLAAGRIDRTAWHLRNEEVLVDQYLATDDPRRMSGKSGDETDWRWSRELVLDAVHVEPCALLDVGCASGYLLASLVRWGAARGRTIEPYGLEISDRLARVARRRYPGWADRIAVGNVATWVPGRRLDLVHLALDMAPAHDRRALVEHVRREYLAPGGRIVLRADRVGGPEPHAPEVVRALGIEPGGVLEAVHPATGALRRTVWFA